MRIAVGSDHAGFNLKNQVMKYLNELGHEVQDFGTYKNESCDYPDYAYAAALSVSNAEAERAIVICYTGIGVSIVANKVKGIRCSLVGSVEDAVLTREHNDSNCLAMGAKYTPVDLAIQIVDTWLGTEFSNMEKHQRRIDKITKYEE